MTNKNSERGINLAELTVVLGIILVLLGLGIMQFSAYKRRAYDATAVADMAKFVAALAQAKEATGEYPANTLPKFAISPGVKFSLELTDEGESFTAFSWHQKGSKTWCYQPKGAGREMGFKGLSSGQEIAKSCEGGRPLVAWN